MFALFVKTVINPRSAEGIVDITLNQPENLNAFGVLNEIKELHTIVPFLPMSPSLKLESRGHGAHCLVTLFPESQRLFSSR
jgi:hypothetical protein